jgi:hypothetical protein
MGKFIPGTTGGNSIFCKFVDQKECYGENIIKKIFDKFKKNKHVIKKILDIGSGECRDLSISHEYYPKAKKYGIEYYDNKIKKLNYNFVNIINSDIEKDLLPFFDNSIDVIISNQVFEHIKELFWIMHQSSKKLKIGGHMIIGVPNVLSFHNRFLMLLGIHPTQFKSYSAHVRIFSKKDFIKFLNVGFCQGFELVDFYGSQFYPFPKFISRILCKLFPNMSFSIFFVIKKIKKYDNQFIEHLKKAKLETPFYIG